MRLKQSNSNLPEYTGQSENKDKICDKGVLEENKKKVLIYIPSITGKFDALFLEGFIYFLSECWNLKKEGYEFYPIIGRGMFIQHARNTAVQHALDNGMDYLLFIDDDMVIKPGSNLFKKLVSYDKDVISPLFFHKDQPYAPLIFKRTIRANGRYTTYDNILDYPKGLVEVDGVGCGVMLIKTEVFKKIPKPYFLYGDSYGEDLYFCNNCINNGIKIWCDTNIVVGHIAPPKITGEEAYIANRNSTELYMKQKIKQDETNSEKLIKDVDIIMPCYHNYEITKEAIQSVLNNTENVNYRLILINDGGDSELEKYFKKLEKYRKNIVHFTNKKNVGFVKSVNQGLTYSLKNGKYSYVLILNNDIKVPNGVVNWLSDMVESAEGDSVGAVGCISDRVMGLQNIEYNKKILLPQHYTKFLIGFCMLIKREAIEKVGFLDERFGIGGNDDLDYSIRLRKAGYKLKVLRNVFIEHKCFCSLGKIYKNYKEIEDLTRPLLIEKWGDKEVNSLFSYSPETLMGGN